MFKKGDKYLIAFILIIVVLSYVGVELNKIHNSGGHRVAVIKQDNKLIDRIDLDIIDKPQRINVTGSSKVTILAEKGRICFEDVDCPDGTCIKTGWLSRNGDTAVCLPNRTIIKIEGEENNVDGATY